MFLQLGRLLSYLAELPIRRAGLLSRSPILEWSVYHLLCQQVELGQSVNGLWGGLRSRIASKVTKCFDSSYCAITSC